MLHHNTIFRQLLHIFSRLEFKMIVKRYKGDYRTRTLKCWDQFIYLLFAQLGKQDSLRDTIDSMNSQQRKLYHIGSQTLCRSTLSDANNKRDYRIYKDLFFTILGRVQQIAPKYKLKLTRKLYSWFRYNRFVFETISLGTISQNQISYQNSYVDASGRIAANFS